MLKTIIWSWKISGKVLLCAYTASCFRRSDTGLERPLDCPSVVPIMFIHWKSTSEIELEKKREN